MTTATVNFKEGDRVYWSDPDDGLCSGAGVITSVKGDDDDEGIYTVSKDDGGEVEALPHELTVMSATTERLEELRAILRTESISYGELNELQGLREHIDPDDVELLEAAGVDEFGEERAAMRRRKAGIAGFTPAPWLVREDNRLDGEYTIHTGDADAPDEVVATVAGGLGSYDEGCCESEANARLIASAPELYAALRALLVECDAYLDYSGNEDAAMSKASDEARAAIAKVEQGG